MAIKRLLLFVLIAWMLQAAAAAPAAASPLALDPAGRIRLLGTADSRVDLPAPPSSMTSQGPQTGRVRRTFRTQRRTTDPVWYRFTLARRSPDDSYAIVWPGIVGRVDLYCDSGGGAFTHESGGYETAKNR